MGGDYQREITRGIGVQNDAQHESSFHGKAWVAIGNKKKKKKSLWAKVIAKKYVRGEIGLKKLNKKQVSSNIWRGMATAAEILRKGARIRVYNGRDTLF